MKVQTAKATAKVSVLRGVWFEGEVYYWLVPVLSSSVKGGGTGDNRFFYKREGVWERGKPSIRHLGGGAKGEGA